MVDGGWQELRRGAPGRAQTLAAQAVFPLAIPQIAQPDFLSTGIAARAWRFEEKEAVEGFVRIGVDVWDQGHPQRPDRALDGDACLWFQQAGPFVAALRPGQDAVIEGVVAGADIVMGRRRSLLVRLQDGSGTLSRAALEEATHLLAQRLAMLYEFNAAEFSEKLLFANVIRNLIDAEILRIGEDGLLQFDERITLAAAQTELLLAADVRHSIQLIARAAPPPNSDPSP